MKKLSIILIALVVSSTLFAGKKQTSLDIIAKVLPLTHKLEQLNQQLEKVIKTKKDWIKSSKQKNNLQWKNYQKAQKKYDQIYKNYNNENA